MKSLKRQILFFLIIFCQNVFGVDINKPDGLIYNNFGGSRAKTKNGENVDMPKVLYIHIVAAKGGGAAQTVTLYDLLFNKGFNIDILVAQDSPIANELADKNLPYYSTNVLNHSGKKDFNKILYSHIEYICKQKKIDVIHCNKPYEYPIVKQVANNLNISSIANYHSYALPDLKKFVGFDGFIAVSPLITEYVKNEVKSKELDIKFIDFIYPPHNEEKFLNFIPTKSKKEFFKDNFNVDIKDLPIVVMVANFEDCKNHKILFEAVNQLVYKDQYPIQVALAGRGGLEKSFREQIELLKIKEYVHFLGFTSLIPELLFHSDIKVLTSKHESFGVSLVEAALMKKPIIFSSSGDAANVLIINEKTGLLFDPEDASDLAIQIKRILQDTTFGNKLGQAVFNLVLTEFSTQVSMDKFENFYQKLFEEKPKVKVKNKQKKNR